MATDVSDRVREIARYRDTGESDVIQEAVERGVDTLCQDVVISKYLDGAITREEAVDELGEDLVREVETAKRAVEEDVAWGLGEA